MANDNQLLGRGEIDTPGRITATEIEGPLPPDVEIPGGWGWFRPIRLGFARTPPLDEMSVSVRLDPKGSPLPGMVKKRRGWLLREEPEGGMIPWGWGVAWRDYQFPRIFTAPMPLHWLIGGARDLYFWCRGNRRRLTQADYMDLARRDSVERADLREKVRDLRHENASLRRSCEHLALRLSRDDDIERVVEIYARPEGLEELDPET